MSCCVHIKIILCWCWCGYDADFRACMLARPLVTRGGGGQITGQPAELGHAAPRSPPLDPI